MSIAAVARFVTNSEPSNVRGMVWMGVAGLLFAAFTVVVRFVASDLDPMQTAFLRYVFGLIFLLPLFLGSGLRQLRTQRVGMHALRGLLHGVGVLLWFYALTRIPIAEVMALGFTSPIFATVGAVLFLGESLRARRIGAVLIAFAGALIILRPGIAAIDIGAVAMLLAAPMFAGSKLIAKSLTRTESTPAIVALLSIFVTLVQLPPALLVWRTPTLEEIFWLMLTAILATASHFAMTQAFRTADLSVTQPVEFLQLVWVALLGLYVFGEIPIIWTWVGGAIIVASASYIAHREAVIARREGNRPQSPPPPNAPP